MAARFRAAASRPLMASLALAGAIAATATASPGGPRWVRQQVAGAGGGLAPVVATGEHGDSVLVSTDSHRDVVLRRARPGRGFGRAVVLHAARDTNPEAVAVAPDGTALVVTSYNDGTTPPEIDDKLGMDCCDGLRTAVWRPGHRPSRAQLVVPKGRVAEIETLAAVRGRRGIVFSSAEDGSALRYAPVGDDGRVRTSTPIRAGDDDAADTLAFRRGRAEVGLVGPAARGTAIRLVRQGHAGGFGAPRTILRATADGLADGDPDRDVAALAADGSGGYLATWIESHRNDDAPRHHARLMALHVDASGRSSRFRVDSGANDDLAFCHAAIDRAGRAVFLYQRFRGRHGQLVAALRDRAQRLRRVVLQGSGDDEHPAVAIGGHGQGLVAYDDITRPAHIRGVVVPLNRDGRPGRRQRRALAGSSVEFALAVDRAGRRRASFVLRGDVASDRLAAAPRL